MFWFDPSTTRRFAARSVAVLASLALLGLGACGESTQKQKPDDSKEGSEEPQPSPSPGKTSFFSAARSSGAPSPGGSAAAGNGAGAAAPSADSASERGANKSGGGKRSIEEGDIYQVVRNSDRILNLNQYRGLQIIDFSDPSQPDVIGRARISGDPVEMYQVGDQVYVLLNSWRGYYGRNQKLLPKRYEGGAVVAIDISDPTNPTIRGRAKVPGRIETSRLTRGNGKEALFVAASGDGSGGRTPEPLPGRGVATSSPADGNTYVKSFNVSGQGKLQSVSKLKLDGRIQDIQGAENHLLVARRRDNNKSSVSIIDISDPAGQMKEGDQVDVKGRVENKHNMDLEGDVLRVVSGADRNDSDTNHAETFDASNIDQLSRIDHATFGDGQNLYATLFMENRAFFVTYLRQDPFHAFEVTSNGKVTEKSEFVVSGWNDYFVPVADGKRLIGIGKNDQQGETVAVSLYDITDLTNPDPLIERQEVELDYSSSEANRDDRAFTVLEDATSVKTQNGTTETGLALVPFQGWEDSKNKHTSGVKIFTFSEDTLTRRGTMEHGTPVRRSFVADHRKKTTANLSEAELSLFDASDPKNPREKGRVELAPNYERLWTFGSYAVRRDVRHSYYYWYHRPNQQSKTDHLEVVPLSKNPDTAEAVSKISVPAGAKVYRAGSYLVSAHIKNRQYNRNGGWRSKVTYETELRIWDLSNPKSPKLVKTMTTNKLQRHRYGAVVAGPGRAEPAVGASVAGRPGYYRPGFNVKAVGDALVFANSVPERTSRGKRYYRRTTVDHSVSRYERCYGAPTPQGSDRRNSSCTYYTGGITCTWLDKKNGGTTDKHCRGEIRKCTRSSNGDTSCKEVSTSDVPTQTRKHSRKDWDVWSHYEFHVLDLSDASSVQLTGPVTMPKQERDVRLMAEGESLYITHRKRYDRPNDPRPYMKYYFKRVDLSTPTSPKVGSSINIPGELLAVDGDTIVTRNYLWGEKVVEPALHKLKVKNGLARLKATHRLNEREIQSLQLDGKGHVLVAHRGVQPTRGGVAVAGSAGGRGAVAQGVGTGDSGTSLSVLGLSSLNELSETKVGGWAELRGARKGRALFSVPGGLLVINLTSPSNPNAQAYFPTRGWPRDLVGRGSSLFIPAGRYGIYTFDVTVNNLL